MVVGAEIIVLKAKCWKAMCVENEIKESLRGNDVVLARDGSMSISQDCLDSRRAAAGSVITPSRWRCKVVWCPGLCSMIIYTYLAGALARLQQCL